MLRPGSEPAAAQMLLIGGAGIGRLPEYLAEDAAAPALSGEVTDSRGAMLQNATVTLTFVSGVAQRIVKTGTEGKFLFLQLSTGD